MPIRQLRSALSLDAVRDELTYTIARLTALDLTRGLAAPIVALRDQLRGVRDRQDDVQDAETNADALVDHADDQLDDRVVLVSDDMLRLVGKNRHDPRFTRYFPDAPHQTVDMALGMEVDKVRGWQDSLATESEASIRAHAPHVAALVTAGDQALAARVKAEGNRNDQRVREIDPLIQAVNDARGTLHRALGELALAHHFGVAWPDRFFRHGRSGHGTDAADAPVAPIATA